MKNETVYVLVHEYQFNDGECGIDVEVFEDLEQAQKRMKEIANDSEISWDECFDTNYVKDAGDMSIDFYECGNYNYNHETITIFQREVK